MSDLRQRALEATRDVIATEGVRAVSMRKVAGRVGVSAPALYRHFDGKEGLIWAAADEGFRIFHEYLVEERAEEPGERVLAAGRGYFRFSDDHPGYYQVIFGDVAGLGEPPPDVSKRADATLEILVDRIRATAAGQRGDPRQLAIVVWSQLHGVVSLRLDQRLQDHEPAAYAALCAKALDHVSLALGLET